MVIWIVVVVVVVVVVEVVVVGEGEEGEEGPTKEADIVVVVSEVTNDVACPSWVNVTVTVFVTH